jgi:heavy metal sensor kinase
MFSSVRVRLTAWYVVVFGCLLIAFSAFIYLLLSRSLFARLDLSLTNGAQTAAELLQGEIVENHGNLAGAAGETLNELHLSNIYLGIFEGDRLLSSSFPEAERVPSPAGLGQLNLDRSNPLLTTVGGFGGAGARVATLKVASPSGYLILEAAEPLREVTEQLESVRRIFYLSFPAALLVTGLGGLLLVRKSLSPVVAMSEQAERISASNLHERLHVGNTRDELGRLASVFNELLSRLDRSFVGMREFMADASHELRTPLAIIRGEADVALSQERDSVEYKEALAIIQDESRRLSRIVDDMLALARADAGQQPLNIREFYLNDLVDECCRAARVLAVTKGVALDFEPAPDIDIQGDEDLLRRLILNLLDNAIKYTPSGGSVSVELRRDDGEASIKVRDTGMGINPEYAGQVFQRFYRVNKSRSRADGGSGLGLSIARWVAEAHSGSIQLTSEPGKGSTFLVSLPL